MGNNCCAEQRDKTSNEDKDILNKNNKRTNLGKVQNIYSSISSLESLSGVE